MRNVFEKDEERFYKAFKLFVELTNKILDKEKADEVFEMCLKYLLETKDDIEIEEMEKIAKEESVERGELIMSIAEKLREEGKLEERKELVVKLLTKRFGKEFSKELQGKILKTDEKTIDYIMDNLLEITIDELKEILK
jgi:hypothetical protein